MTTRIFGYSDDNVEAEGDISDEWGCYDTDLVLTFSDGTVLRTHYGKTLPDGSSDGIWTIILLNRGSLFEGIQECFDSDAEIYSDIAHFQDGLTGVTVEAA